MDQVDIAGVRVGRLTRARWVDHLEHCVLAGGAHHHVSMNAAKWVAMRRDPAFAALVRRASSVAADGVGIVAASRVLGTPLPERVPGCELAEALVGRAQQRGWRVALYGARPAVLTTVAEGLRSRRINVVSAIHGFQGDVPPSETAEQIAAAAPHLLLVALGTPRAEWFIDEHLPTLGVPLAMGVGGTFDVWAGATRRAPEPLRSRGLEWAWRWAGAPRARFSRAVVDSARFVHAIARGRRIAS